MHLLTACIPNIMLMYGILRNKLVENPAYRLPNTNEGLLSMDAFRMRSHGSESCAFCERTLVVCISGGGDGEWA